MPKINRAGQAKILTKPEMARLFRAFRHDDHRLIFGICRYTAERIGAVLQLQPLDAYDPKGNVRPIITFRGKTRKGSNHKAGKTRQVPIHAALHEMLEAYPREKGAKWLFPSPLDPNKHISHQALDLALRTACDRAGLGDRGISTHSFRRTAITELAKAGVGIRTIQKITGHAKLEQLTTYIEVSEEEVIAALESL